MEQWFASNWSAILLTLVTSGALAFCGYLWKQVKEYKRLLKQEEIKQEEVRIDEKLEPIIEDMEELRKYVRQVDKDEKHKIEFASQNLYQNFHPLTLPVFFHVLFDEFLIVLTPTSAQHSLCFAIENVLAGI